MAEIALNGFSSESPLHQRIVARLQAQISWNDDTSDEKVTVQGTTENLGETSALVNMDILPSVGSDVRLRLIDENETIIDVLARVIRVERDPAKPQAALSIAKNMRKWKEIALTAAKDWVSRDIKHNYVDDGWLN